MNMEEYEKTSLDCPVCMEQYNEQLHTPKMMPCLHTVCADCLAAFTASLSSQDYEAQVGTPSTRPEPQRADTSSHTEVIDYEVVSVETTPQLRHSNSQAISGLAAVLQNNRDHPALRRMSGHGPITSPTSPVSSSSPSFFPPSSPDPIYEAPYSIYNTPSSSARTSTYSAAPSLPPRNPRDPLPLPPQRPVSSPPPPPVSFSQSPRTVSSSTPRNILRISRPVMSTSSISSSSSSRPLSSISSISNSSSRVPLPPPPVIRSSRPRLPLPPSSLPTRRSDALNSRGLQLRVSTPLVRSQTSKDAIKEEVKEPHIPKDKLIQCPLCRSDVNTSRLQTNRYVVAHLRDFARLKALSLTPSSSNCVQSPLDSAPSAPNLTQSEASSSTQTQSTAPTFNPAEFWCISCDVPAREHCSVHDLSPIQQWAETLSASVMELENIVGHNLALHNSELDSIERNLKTVLEMITKASRHLQEAKQEAEAIRNGLVYTFLDDLPSPPNTSSTLTEAKKLSCRLKLVRSLEERLMKLETGADSSEVYVYRQNNKLYISTSNPDTTIITTINHGRNVNL